MLEAKSIPEVSETAAREHWLNSFLISGICIFWVVFIWGYLIY